MNYKIYFIDLIENEYANTTIKAVDIRTAINEVIKQVGHEGVYITRVDIVY